MKCDMVKFGPSAKVAGYAYYKCRRRNCPQYAHSPYSPDSISSRCNGIPEWWEIGCWVEAALRVFGISKERWAWIWGNPACTTCEQREQDLNTLGVRFKQGLLSIWGKIRAFWNKE